MSTRRTFIQQVIGGAATLAAGNAYASKRSGPASDRVRFALIGCGGRGTEILKAAVGCANVEAVAVADVYTRRLDEIKTVVPQAKPYQDFRRLLDDKTIDAVLIATPQHQHALNFVPAIQAGKDVYQEKTMAFNPDHARRMRRALEGSGRVVQVGIQSTSGPALEQARGLATPERMGTLTAIHTHMYRNSPYGGWKRPLPADCDPSHVDWTMFQGEAAPHDFDPNRVVKWRFYWDYSGGNVYENMCHQLAFWYKAMNLSIPRKVTMTGGLYLWKDGREVPDTMAVSMEHSEELLYAWNSGFGNDQLKVGDDVLGDNVTLSLSHLQSIRYIPQKVTRGKDATEMMGTTKSDPKAHMINFLDHIRGNVAEVNCPFELGFRVAIACRMAVDSYRQQRTLHWDAAKEQIV